MFRALACDYDGTIASGDRIVPAALDALARAREAGLRLILVTGRTFFELTRVCEHLDLFEAVVAENGAVLYQPAVDTIADLAPPPPPRLLAELDRRGIPYQLGRAIIGTARAREAEVREALAAAGVALDLIPNRGALMLLPAGITKGSGVRVGIRELGLSFHDVLALGDAENDLDLFAACGAAGCPASAEAPVRERADWVFPGADGEAIADAIRGPLLGGDLARDRRTRDRLLLGWAVETAEPVTIPARGVNVLVQGDPLSGKSWLAGALIERLRRRAYATCVIDAEGDYHVLSRIPGVTAATIDGERAMNEVLGLFGRTPTACVIANLADLSHARKVEVIEHGLVAIGEMRARVGLPHWVVIDEAHYSLHPGGVAEPALATLAEKGFCLVTYRSSWLRPSVIGALDVVILGRTGRPDEQAFLDTLLTGPAWRNERVAAAARELPRGQFVAIQADRTDTRTAVSFVPTPRETPHVRHRGKYAESALFPDRRFVFRWPDGRLAGTADSFASFREAIASIAEPVLAGHARRRDLSRWVRDVFADHALGVQLRKLEARWERGEVADLRQEIEHLISFRYDAEP
jgi:hydroxymethylpyrimidine pyrophosphatase-like HAD family hydrolase